MADDNNEVASLVSLLSQLENASDHPESYLKPPSSLEKDNVIAVKQIFDFCKKDEPNSSRSLANTCPLQELLVEGFDVEQIWQEIELQNTSLLHNGKVDVKSVKQNAEKLSLLSARSKEVERNQSQGLKNSEDKIVGEKSNGFLRNATGSESESDSVDKESCHEDNSDDEADGDDYDDADDDGGGDESDDDNLNKRKRSIASKDNKKQKPSAKKSQVDDTFFKLSDMLQFLDKEDRKFEREHEKKGQKEDDNDDDDSSESESELVDYFVDIGGDNDADDDEDDEDWNKAVGATESLLGRCTS